MLLCDMILKEAQYVDDATPMLLCGMELSDAYAAMRHGTNRGAYGDSATRMRCGMEVTQGMAGAGQSVRGRWRRWSGWWWSR